MKILFIIEQYVDEGARYYREFFRHLRRKGASVSVVNLSESEPFLDDVGEFLHAYHPLALSGDYYKALPTLNRIIRDEGTSVIQAIETIPAFYAALAVLPVLRSRPPLVYGRRHGRTEGPVHKLMDQVAFSVSSKVIAVSEAMARVAREEHPWGKRKVIPIFSGIVLEAGVPKKEGEGRALAELGKTEDRYTVLLLARLRPIKGHRIALQAAQILRRKGKSVRFLFVGEGPDREALQGEVAARGLEDSVTFTGHVEHVREALELADVMIIPSFADAFPKVMIEAFAAGLPVIASAVGGLTDMIEHGETGLLVPPGDGEALAEAIEALMADRQLADHISSRGKLVYEDTLTPETMVEAYWSVYRDLVEGR
ncbi:glycosyltransferase family 4 protein [Gemmatimonadota bacterium]